MSEDFGNVRDLIIGIRGGIPDRCDFCNEPCNEECLEPEEGGQWACHKCLSRWDEAEKEQRKLDAAHPDGVDLNGPMWK